MATWLEDNVLGAATAVNGTLTKPTGTAAGHVLGIFYSLENDQPIVAPNGFIISSNQDHASALHDQFFLWKRAGGAEGASYVVTHASTWRSGYIVAVQNASATRAVHGGSGNQGTSATGTALGATSEGADAYALATYTTFADMGLITPTAGWTERWDPTNNIYIQDKAMVAAGSAGDAAITFAVSQNWMARQFIVEDDGYNTTDPSVIQVKHNVITASRSPSVTFDFAPLENDIVAFWPSSTVVGATLTIPADWVNILSGTTDVESDAHQLCAVYHRVTAAEAAAVTTTFTATNLYGATVTGNVMGVVIRNVDTTTAVDVTSSTFDSANTATPHVLQGLTPTVDNGLFMSGVASDGVVTYSIPPTDFDLAALNTNQGKAVAWRETLTSNGVAIANTNLTPSAGDEYCTISVVWRKAAGGGGGLTVTPTDNLGLTDAVTFARELARVELLGITDAVAIDEGKGIIDLLGLTDAANVEIGRSVTATDNLGLTDSVTLDITKLVVQTDNLGLIDAATTTLAFAQAPTDNLGLTDQVAVARSISLTFTDTLGITDTASVDVTKLITPTDLLGITDAATTALDCGVTQVDTLGITDSVQLDRTLSVTDVLGLTDSAAVARNIVIAVTDNLGITDSAQVDVQASGQVNPVDTLGITDTATLTGVFARLFTDAVGLTDTAQVARSITLVFTESLGITDQSSQTSGTAVTVVDTLGLTDAVVLARDIHLTIVDALGITDFANPQITQSVIVVTDPLGLTDSVQLVRQVALTFTDPLGLTDVAVNDGYPPTVITCDTLTTVRIDADRTTRTVNELRIISAVSTWKRKRGDVNDFILAGINGVTSLAGAIVTTTLRQRATIVHPPVTIFNPLAEGNLPPIIRVNLALWLPTAATGRWLMEHDILFADGLNPRWPSLGYDQIIVSEALT